MSEHPLRLATIDLAAVRHNVLAVKAVVGDADVMAVVKAGGYGHGAAEIARAAVTAGATWLGVADVDEGVALREAGLTEPILAWLHGPEAYFDVAIRYGIDVGVSSVAQLDAVAGAARRVAGDAVIDGAEALAGRPSGSEPAETPAVGRQTRDDHAATPARVQIKVDTGLGRNGAVEADWVAVFARAAELEAGGVLSVVGIFSHLSNASDDDDLEQLARFESAVEQARGAGLNPAIIHLAATAAALRLAETRLSLVRLGIGLYGLSPFDGVTSAELGLRPAMTLEGRVIAVKRVPPESGVSYGYTYRTTTESTLALVGLGYADGIPRLGSNRAPVWINGNTYTVTGRIAMDQFVVDMHDDAVEVGDRVVLFGDPAEGYPAVEEWAEAAETINYEIVTRIGPRFERRYLA
ncbi:alanine racemase [Subtercola lobariae]|uniref:Alanine racemase n=1 Tax=Subtercola lobariae TaxID=1588641 RepID=A0A917EW10_9MICO|nr:alanine racemase [Subtercola lobariae]GGF20111.1 alanine racemase [Subtercola lobariae]